MDVLTVQHPDAKVLIFTEAADTARYVSAELVRRGVGDAGLVTGDTDDPTSVAQRFSPVSNGFGGDGKPVRDELRILVSTDVLSEGQNLQDAHIVVNYDLPWAIVKLVQRAGRVDRIGQRSAEVLVVSLMPDAPVEKEIELRGRVLRRLGENAQLLGSDEAFFGDHSERQVISGVFDESSGFGLGAGVDEVDPVSMAYEIWRHAESADPDLAKKVAALPNVVYATKTLADSPADAAPGVVIHTQTHAGADAFAFIEPSGNGRRVTPQEALRLAESEPSTPPTPRLDGHHDLVAAALSGALRTPTGRTSGALQGVRGKVWNRFDGQLDNFTDTLWVTKADLEAALDAINERPLYDSAIQRLARALRERSDDDLAALIVDLHSDDRLCVPPVPQGDHAEPSIVCSMGLRSAVEW